MNAETLLILLLIVAGLIILVVKIGLIHRTVSAVQGITGLAAAHPIAACVLALLFILMAMMDNLNIWSII